MNERSVKHVGRSPFWIAAGTLLLILFTTRAQQVEQEARRIKYAFVDEATGKRTMLLTGGSVTNISNEELLIYDGARLQSFDSAGKTNLDVASPRCFYNTKMKMVSSAENIQATSPDGRFSLAGDGFQYQIATGSLVISNRVRATIHKDVLGAQSLAKTNANPGAEQLLHVYSDRLRYQTNHAVFEGAVRVEDAQGKMTCDLLTADIAGPDRRIEDVFAEQSVVIESAGLRATGGRAAYHLKTDVVTLSKNPSWRLGQREGRAEEVTFGRRTREFHARRDVEMKLPSDSIGRNGFIPAGVESPPKIEGASAKMVELFTDDFSFQPDAAETNSNLAVCRGHVRIAGDKGNLSCESMTIKSVAEGGQTESVVAEQNVVMERGNSRVTGERAFYSATNDTLEVSGHPAWRMARREGTAGVLVFDLKNETYRALRGVQMRLPPGSFGRTPWLLPVTQAKAGAVAHPTAAVTPTGNEMARPIEISSDDFEFRSALSRTNLDTAVYRGDVRAVDPERMTLTCEQLTSEILSGTNQVRSVMAERDVDIEVHQPDGEQRARGDKAVYLAGTSEVELTGSDGVKIDVTGVKGAIEGTGARVVYAAARDAFELIGNPMLSTPGGQAWGDAVIFDRANTTVKATGRWRLKLNPEVLKSAAKQTPKS